MPFENLNYIRESEILRHGGIQKKGWVCASNSIFNRLATKDRDFLLFFLDIISKIYFFVPPGKSQGLGKG